MNAYSLKVIDWSLKQVLLTCSWPPAMLGSKGKSSLLSAGGQYLNLMTSCGDARMPALPKGPAKNNPKPRYNVELEEEIGETIPNTQITVNGMEKIED